MNEEELKKDILYDLEMQLYMEFNDKIATMNDYLGEIYSYKDIEDVKQAEQIRKIVLMENAIKQLQQEKKEITFTLNEIVKQINKETRDMPRDKKKECLLNIKYKIKGILMKLGSDK